MLLTQIIQRCAPQVAPTTMVAIVRVESGTNPLAMWNNTTHSRVLPANLQQAQVYLRAAMAAGDRVDVGLSQVDTENFAAFGLSPDTVFNACTNLRAGAQILAADYRQAVSAYGPGPQALFHAFEAYNSGRLWGDRSYANRILSAAGLPVEVQSDGGLAYRRRGHTPLVFVESWGARQVTQPKPVKTGLVYVLNW